MASCTDCGKEFDNKGSLDQHFSAKHVKKPESPVYRKKSGNRTFVIVAVAILLVAGIVIAISLNGGDEEKQAFPCWNKSG